MIEFHPLANLFPLIEGTDFEDLALDIADHGLHESIWLLDGKILDGRNRYLAAIEAGVIDRNDSAWRDDGGLRHSFLEFNPDEDGDPLAFVISMNLHRRQLDESQRATVAAKIANMRQGERTDLAEPSANLPKVAQADAARMLNVSERSLRTAKTVIEKGVPELQQAVERGEITVSAAAAVASQPEEVQRRLVEVDSPAFHAEVKRIREAKQAKKKERRETRERELGARQQALPTKKYGVIYADPEWRFEPWSRETGMDRAPENHYPTSETIDIISRPVRQIAADDAVLFLWVTGPMLKAGLEVMDHWGFEYKTNFAWGKDRIGPGYWNREKHELLLLGTRGNVPCPAPGQQWDSLQLSARGAHSAKPGLFADMIEAYFPNLPKIELNCRGAPRPGWDAWGNEAETEEGQLSADPETEIPVTVEEFDEGVTGLSEPLPGIPADEGVELPAWLNRANWVDGHPPARAAAAIMSIEEGAAHG